MLNLIMKRRDYIRKKILYEIASSTSPTATPAGPRPGGLGGNSSGVIGPSSTITARPKAAPYGAPRIGPAPMVRPNPAEAQNMAARQRELDAQERMKRIDLKIAQEKNKDKPTTSKTSSITASYYPKGSALYETLKVFKKSLKEQKTYGDYK